MRNQRLIKTYQRSFFVDWIYGIHAIQTMLKSAPQRVAVLARGVDGEAARDGVERREEERAWLGLGLGLGLGSGLGLGLG